MYNRPEPSYVDLLLEETKVHTLLMWLALPSSQPFLVSAFFCPILFFCFKAVYKHTETEKSFQIFHPESRKCPPAPQDVKGTPIHFLAAPQFSCEPSGTSENVSNNRASNKRQILKARCDSAHTFLVFWGSTHLLPKASLRRSWILLNC